MTPAEIFDQMFNLCIIGAGPAGIIIALEYSRNAPNDKVLLVEYGNSGKKSGNELDNSIQLTNPTNHYSPEESTNKGMGGTSATWGGRCVMYDEIDFLDRPILKGECTWNLNSLEDLQQYLPRAANYFECGNPDFNLNLVDDYQYHPIAEGFSEGIVLDSKIERWSMPTRFGKRYKKDIQEYSNLIVLEAFEARDFAVPDETGKVNRLIIRNVISKKVETVHAKRFVIAAGAQESTRILLRNKQLFANLKDAPIALGKYYQGHLSGKIATVKFYGDPLKTDYGFIVDKEGIFLRRRFQFSTEYLQEKNLLNTAIWLDNPLYYDPAHRNGPMSFMYLALISPILGKKLAPPAISRTITKGKVTGIPQHIGNIIRDLPNSLLIPATTFYKRYLLKRKLPGVFLFSPTNEYALHFHSEQVPEYENQMRLGDDETLIIEYNLSDTDADSVVKLHDALDKWLRKCNCGELKYHFPSQELKTAIKSMSKDGIHQCGTTRMGESPELGVVDSNLKVWGTENVFVCSSSVFPTSSQANPTFMLGAYAVRLADHLVKQK
ncbi:GMC family oxidoreductase [Cytophagaceae bacterium SJW1-29]|uniref:GMC family oxidoreductase n=2 Tax=Salmonirosea aquatica TaxID=2654236 RepID=A0A7C9FQP7_9BACT|nr:GMC family oxidoreductase [Cytophagaceae bacterium SJW1-29]